MGASVKEPGLERSVESILGGSGMGSRRRSTWSGRVGLCMRTGDQMHEASGKRYC